MADSWSVVSQRETTTLAPGGTFEPSIVVTFKTDKGITGSVTVPESNYTPDNVKALIDEKVDTMHTVHTL